MLLKLVNIIIILLYIFYSKIVLSEIVLPEPGIIKAFSSFSKLDKYSFKLGINLYTSTASSSVGLDFNILNNMNQIVSPFGGIDIRYHFFSTNNILSKLNQSIDIENSDILKYDIKINPIMDFLFKLGLKFKINDSFSLSAYGIIGVNWSKTYITNTINKTTIIENNDKTTILKNNENTNVVETDNREEIYGTKILTLEDYLNYYKDYTEYFGTYENIGYFYFFNKPYSFKKNEILDKVNNNDFHISQIIKEEEGYTLFTSVTFFTSNTIEGLLEQIVADPETGIKKDEYIFIKNNDFDNSNSIGTYKKENKPFDEETNIDYLEYNKTDTNIKVYKTETCEGNECSFKFEYEKNTNTTENNNEEKIKTIEKDITKETITQPISSDNKWIGKYGCGIEFTYKNRISFKIEYLYTNFNNISSVIDKKINIHEINFGLGVYVW